MHRAAALLAFLCVLSHTPCATAASRLDRPHVPGELIVGFSAGTSGAEQEAVHARVGARVVERSPAARRVLVRFPEREDLAAREAAYLADPRVAFAHPNYLGGIGFVPADTDYALCWHHHNIGQSGGIAGADIESEPGWDTTRGSAAVVVALLDTGIDLDHREFAGRIVPGWDFVNADSLPEDDNGHGTEVAGVLAADAGNGFGVAGVDHFCRMMPVKVVNAAGIGTTFDLMQGLDWARTHGARVVNMSLIDYPITSGLTASLQAAEAAGLILVACAGNGGIGDADVSGPGASPHTISVGATNSQDERTGFSGTGSALELVAPGRDVPTVLWNSDLDGSTLFTGCSAAAPIVAGIASLLEAIRPGLTQAEARTLLRAGAEDGVGHPTEDTPGWDPYYGWGRVNLSRVLAAVDITGAGAPAAGSRTLALTVAPNPLRGRADVRYDLPRPGDVRVSVYDVAGRLVRTLASGPRGAGRHVVAWEGSTASAPAPGVYFVRITAGEASLTRKVTVLR